MSEASGPRFNLRLVKIRRVQRLRVVGRVVRVEHVAVVESARLPRPLVPGKVPAGGKL